jgi:hypothetical protein
MIEAIPQASRNFLSAADFAPGVRFDTDPSGNTRLRGGSQNIDNVNVFIDVGRRTTSCAAACRARTPAGQPVPADRHRRVPRADAELQGRVRPGLQRGDQRRDQIRRQ